MASGAGNSEKSMGMTQGHLSPKPHRRRRMAASAGKQIHVAGAYVSPGNHFLVSMTEQTVSGARGFRAGGCETPIKNPR
jgi:hypothetical protein